LGEGDEHIKMTTVSQVQSAAALERQRLAQQAAQARAQARAQAQQAETETEAQAREAISETEQQAQAARSEVQQEAESRQAEIRKQRGQAEREAEAAKAQARQVQRVEQRKAVLPISKPRDLGLTSYIANVESARKQAHQAGGSAKTAVTKLRDDYFNQVDKAKDAAIADINKQKAGVITDIQTQLVNINADITKQLANANSGVNEWEAESKAKIAKAQADYEAAIKAALNRSGTEVFADMKSKGLIDAKAVYESYDKTTGQLTYTIPDTRSGEDIFAAEQKAGNIPNNATYKSYDQSTGQLTYTIPSTATASGQSTQTTTPGQNSTNVVATATKAALPAIAVIGITGVGESALQTGLWSAGILDPEPISKAIILVIAGLATYFGTKKIISEIEKSKKATAQQAADAVVTNKDGTAAYSVQQFTFTPEGKGRSTTSVPLEQAKSFDIKDYLPNITPMQERLILEQERIQPQGIPLSSKDQIVIIRDRFDVPELHQKASNLLVAAAGVQAAANNITKTIPMTREQWDRVEEALRQGRVAEGKRIIEKLAKKAATPTIARNITEAYREYLRKKAILDAARKAYVASLNPQPIKGKGSTDATAAAIGIWFAQDIIQGRVAKALKEGKSLSQAIAEAQADIKVASQQLGLTQQQISAATATTVYQVALSGVAQAAIQAASQAQTQNLTATQTQVRIREATRTAAQTAVQSAVATQTLTLAQAAELAKELDQVAEAVATISFKIKLPTLPADTASITQKEYPDGTIVWNMGEIKRGPEYKIIPPPYTLLKPISSKYPPKGMTKTKGTPQETLTFIGGKVPFENVSFDLGVTDGFIDVKAKTIRFTGHGRQTNVGTRIESTTKGLALKHNPPLMTRPRLERVSARPRRGKLVSQGVYTDTKGQRMARRPHRHWRRIY
jgi:hypothetical protein